MKELELIPLRGLYKNFKCHDCGPSHLVAIQIKCTNCDAETWWGYVPRTK